MDPPVVLRVLSDAASVQRFMEGRQSPIVEPGWAVLLYQGAARSVVFLPMMWGLPNRAPFRRLDGSDLWYLELKLPEGSRIEYKLEVDGQWLDDPRNPHVSHNPFGSVSVLRAHGYRPPDWAVPDAQVPPGTLEEMDIGGRQLTVYRPARFSSGLPLIFVHDGGDYLRYAGLQTVLDNLMQSRSIPPALVALSHPRERLAEYAANPNHARYVIDEAIPAVADRYDTSSERFVAGASLGAVAALHVVHSAPGHFQGLILQSGSFAAHVVDGPERSVLEPIAHFLQEMESSKLPRRVFLSCGTYEGTLSQNRVMAKRLEAAGLEIKYEEASDGHAWEAWRDRLGSGLQWVLGVGGPSAVI